MFYIALRTALAVRIQGAVRSAVVVVLAPVVDDAAHVAQAREPVLRQALVSEAAVEALDVGVLYRLAWLDEPQLDAVAGCPSRTAGEL
jgi:hypothetical protein